MSEESHRVELATRQIDQALEDVRRLDNIPDPVARRRMLVAVATQLRSAANRLDQDGWLTS